MPWKYQSEDGKIEVIVEPKFRGDLIALASVRPVWVVDSPANSPKIDASWAMGRDAGLFEVNRYPIDNPDDRERNQWNAASRVSRKSRVAVASGPIMRSAEECEMSRSCQSATFSSAGVT